ncbi:MAG: hypothetical protein H6737_11620 [Alphaproteobacteria bacterium]|nr:hypothetical protein [Alphaproteobacteria bacterium]
MMWTVLAALAAERPPPAGPPTERLEYASVVLSSQLRVLVAHHPTWKTVSIATVIEGGQVSEPTPGASRALVDAWLASSPSGRPVRDAYDRLGAEAKVRVEPESTVFWVHGPADATEPLLLLERQRLSRPLAQVDSAPLPSRPAVDDGFTSRYLEVAFETLYPEGHPYHAIWRPPAPGASLASAASLAEATWTPARTTLVVAGPTPPSRVLCLLDATRCGSAPDLQLAEATLALPEPSAWEAPDLPSPVDTDVGPVEAGISSPVVLLGWSLPGIDAGGLQIDRFARSFVEGALREQAALPEHGLSRCHLFEGRANSTLLCVVRGDAGLDVRRLRKRLRHGWSTKGLDESAEGWRKRQLAGLLGASGDAEHVQAVAEHLHRSQEVDVHGGELSALAFGAEAVERLLDEVLTEERMVVVRLTP